MPEGETGFLRIGERPQRNVEDVQMALRLIGTNARPPEAAKDCPLDKESTVTENDSAGRPAQMAEPEEEDALEKESLVSFGKKKPKHTVHKLGKSSKSQMAKPLGRAADADFKPKNKEVLKIVHKPIDCRPQGPTLAQHDIDSLFKSVKENSTPAQAAGSADGLEELASQFIPHSRSTTIMAKRPKGQAHRVDKSIVDHVRAS